MISKAVLVKILREIDRTAEPCVTDTRLVCLEEDDETEENPSVCEECEGEEISDVEEYCVKDGAENVAPLILETKGVIAEDGDNVSVTYQTHLNEVLPSCITYSFNRKHLDALTVRTFQIGESFEFFTKGRLQLFSEDESGTGETVSRFTSVLKNHITYENGGYIELEYFDENSGAITAHCKEFLAVEPIASKSIQRGVE